MEERLRIWVLIWALILGQVVAAPHGSPSECFHAYRHRALVSEQGLMIVSSDVMSCKDRCLHETSFLCLSVDFHPHNSSCVLKEDSALINPHLLAADPMVNHYERLLDCMHFHSAGHNEDTRDSGRQAPRPMEPHAASKSDTVHLDSRHDENSPVRSQKHDNRGSVNTKGKASISSNVIDFQDAEQEGQTRHAETNAESNKARTHPSVDVPVQVVSPIGRRRNVTNSRAINSRSQQNVKRHEDRSTGDALPKTDFSLEELRETARSALLRLQGGDKSLHFDSGALQVGLQPEVDHSQPSVNIVQENTTTSNDTAMIRVVEALPLPERSDRREQVSMRERHTVNRKVQVMTQVKEVQNAHAQPKQTVAQQHTATAAEKMQDVEEITPIVLAKSSPEDKTRQVFQPDDSATNPQMRSDTLAILGLTLEELKEIAKTALSRLQEGDNSLNFDGGKQETDSHATANVVQKNVMKPNKTGLSPLDEALPLPARSDKRKQVSMRERHAMKSKVQVMTQEEEVPNAHAQEKHASAKERHAEKSLEGFNHEEIIPIIVDKYLKSLNHDVIDKQAHDAKDLTRPENVMQNTHAHGSKSDEVGDVNRRNFHTTGANHADLHGEDSVEAHNGERRRGRARHKDEDDTRSQVTSKHKLEKGSHEHEATLAYLRKALQEELLSLLHEKMHHQGRREPHHKRGKSVNEEHGDEAHRDEAPAGRHDHISGHDDVTHGEIQPKHNHDHEGEHRATPSDSHGLRTKSSHQHAENDDGQVGSHRNTDRSISHDRSHDVVIKEKHRPDRHDHESPDTSKHRASRGTPRNTHHGESHEREAENPVHNEPTRRTRSTSGHEHSDVVRSSTGRHAGASKLHGDHQAETEGKSHSRRREHTHADGGEVKDSIREHLDHHSERHHAHNNRATGHVHEREGTVSRHHNDRSTAAGHTHNSDTHASQHNAQRSAPSVHSHETVDRTSRHHSDRNAQTHAHSPAERKSRRPSSQLSAHAHDTEQPSRRSGSEHKLQSDHAHDMANGASQSHNQHTPSTGHQHELDASERLTSRHEKEGHVSSDHQAAKTHRQSATSQHASDHELEKEVNGVKIRSRDMHSSHEDRHAERARSKSRRDEHAHQDVIDTDEASQRSKRSDIGQSRRGHMSRHSREIYMDSLPENEAHESLRIKSVPAKTKHFESHSEDETVVGNTHELVLPVADEITLHDPEVSKRQMEFAATLEKLKNQYEQYKQPTKRETNKSDSDRKADLDAIMKKLIMENFALEQKSLDRATREEALRMRSDEGLPIDEFLRETNYLMSDASGSGSGDGAADGDGDEGSGSGDWQWGPRERFVEEVEEKRGPLDEAVWDMHSD